ncbi:RecQ family ATP-dependent DNA helicase [Membranihabitans maritimus]|uniref:RecQ family ATP-dependent DNA helicase n=1 Tax=Membranihabitans maritimus TaxID=2904244 RepID=UPI001EFF87E4|nr:RecQ family ATP-dependent DNA helicase [Membranihabitans maritimus]
MEFYEVLKRYWGYESFREGQYEAIESIDSGRDTLLILPTGGGKSLCYQIPAIKSGKVCLVITPLIALMEDQVSNLKRKGVNAEYWHSGMSDNEQRRIVEIFRNTKEHLLFYLSPERLDSEYFRELTDPARIAFVAVDEAHCISQWGYNFRPAYRKISTFREKFPGLPVIAMTATAAPIIEKDIIGQLMLNNPRIFKRSIYKPNLSIFQEEEPDKNKFLANYTKSLEGSGIIYYRNRNGTEKIAAMLSNYGRRCTFYHAGMAMEERALVQKKWLEGKFDFIVATNAFGMGIDKDNVRWIIHLAPPPSLEEYYQEIGRAGRDLKHAKSYLLWTEFDFEDMKSIIDIKYPDLKSLKRILRNFFNYFQLPVSREPLKIEFNIDSFVSDFKDSFSRIHHAFSLLDRLEFLSYSEPQERQAMVRLNKFKINLEDLKRSSPKILRVINHWMRTIENAFWTDIEFSMDELAFELDLDKEDLFHRIKVMKSMGMIKFTPPGNFATVLFSRGRPSIENIYLDKKVIDELKSRELHSLKVMEDFIKSDHCRFQALRTFFGEEKGEPCRHCDIDYLIEANNKEKLEEIKSLLKDKLKKHPLDIFDFVVGQDNEYLAKEAIRDMYRQQLVKYSDNKLKLNIH